MIGSKECNRPAPAIGIHCRLPVVLFVIASTALPVELRSIADAPLDFHIRATDVLVNLVAYFALGAVLAEFGLGKAILAAALLSLAAESSQFVMMHRAPSVVDWVVNVIGAIPGAALARCCGFRQIIVAITPRRAVAAAALVVGIVLWVRWMGEPPPTRGLTAPGILEAHWRFDEDDGRRVFDSSGHSLAGNFRGNPIRCDGVLGRAIQLNGRTDSVSCGAAPAFRLAGSMTICAWIQSTAYPRDDAAIVSTFAETGFQLDTTIDCGPRTIGFKLADTCGELMARYGRTPLQLNSWYHLAGVYDAKARTLDVYLNGELDNGNLVGTVTSSQHNQRETLRIGRRSGLKGFEFSGAIDDVRVYSTALQAFQIPSVMQGAAVPLLSSIPAESPPALCLRYSDNEDAILPAIAAIAGSLAGISWMGLRLAGSDRAAWSTLAPLGLGWIVGMLLLAGERVHLPSFNRWLIPLTGLAMAASVTYSQRRLGSPDSEKERVSLGFSNANRGFDDPELR